MRAISTSRNNTRLRLALVAVAALAIGAGAAFAEDVSADRIVNALSPKKPLTRSLSAPRPVADPAETKFVDTLRNRTTRSLSSSEREHIAEVTKDKPNIDLEINFDYNSANISRQAEATVAALGKALTDPALKGSTFVLAGHTDGVGSDHYNQDLSERRAESVKRVLMEKYGLARGDLVAVGYGKSKLKDAAHPADAVNRRVQVVNMSTQNTASK